MVLILFTLNSILNRDKMFFNCVWRMKTRTTNMSSPPSKPERQCCVDQGASGAVPLSGLEAWDFVSGFLPAATCMLFLGLLQTTQLISWNHTVWNQPVHACVVCVSTLPLLCGVILGRVFPKASSFGVLLWMMASKEGSKLRFGLLNLWTRLWTWSLLSQDLIQALD